MTSNPSTPNDKRSSTTKLEYADPTDSGNNSITNSPSNIRPRNRRLISTSTELSSKAVGDSSSSSITRAVSPIPSRHPSRLADLGSVKGNGNNRPVGGVVLAGQGNDSPKFGIGKGLWDGAWTGSWSAIQGLASSVLGVEVDDGIDQNNNLRPTKPTLRSKGKGGSTTKKPTPSAWGPSGGVPKKLEDSVGAGSLAARDADLKARKTASVLESHEGVNGGLDVNGKHKRRISQEDLRSNRPRDDETDALVYVHHVQPSDTLAGVVLKYNCQPAVFRKANRLWPNDVIQVRKVVFLPVDACTIKGRPCDPPSEDQQQIDLLAPTPRGEDPPRRDTGPLNLAEGETSFGESTYLDEEEPPWIHVRWVLLDSSPSARPVEIARLPRKTLGYFPPRRRKSQVTASNLSTPRSSFDFAHRSRISSDMAGSPIGSPSRRLSNLNPGSLPRDSYFPSQTASTLPRSRRDSTSEAIGRLRWMQGPGGVGTFDRNVKKPGPAQDGFNSWAAKHMPSLTIGDLPSSSVSGTEITTWGFHDELDAIDEGPFKSIATSGTVTPNPVAQGLGLEHAAAAIEGWVRRLGSMAPSTPKNVSGRRATSTEVGDLIELLDGTGSDDGRGFEPAPGASRSAPIPSSATGGTGREDSGLNSIRGRMGLLGGPKGGKSD